MKNVGLVLSGGMGKGAYQVGALLAINEFFEPSDFKYVSAASVGVLNTYTFLTNNLEKAKEIWENVNLKGNKRFIMSVLRSSFLKDIIDDITSDKKIPNSFYIPLLNLRNRELKYYNLSDVNEEDINSYLKASVAMPMYNKGIKINNEVLYDGAVVDNIPIYPVITKDLDYMICIYFDEVNYIFEDTNCEDKIIRLTFSDNKFISNSVYIRHESIISMIDHGYTKTKEILSFVFKDGMDDIKLIKNNIIELNKRNLDNKETKKRITGDVIVTNFNKLAKKIIRHNKLYNKNIKKDY